MRIILISICLVALCACGEQEKKSDVPGSEHPSLTNYQMGQTSFVAGSLGDVINYMGEQNQSLAARAVANKDFRKTNRQKLRASIDLQSCSVKKTDNKYSMTGVNCAVRIKTERELSKKGDLDGDYFVRKSFRQDFTAQKASVNTDIQDLSVVGLEETRINYDGDIYDLRRDFSITADAVSRTLGRFNYIVKSKIDRKVNFITNEKNSEVIERTDTLSFKDYSAVLYRKIEFKDAKLEGDNYYLNGETINEQEYIDFMQDLNIQLGLGKASGKSNYYDPFS